MPNAYPYTISNNKIEPLFNRIRTAARPERFSIRETLHKWGFSASNDRALIAVLKDLGFLNEGAAPTAAYDDLKDPTRWKYALARQMRETYADLFAIDDNIFSAPDTEIKGAIGRITGKDDDSVKRYYATFKTLAGLADFNPRALPSDRPRVEEPQKVERKEEREEKFKATTLATDFHYNIQIHLPVTSDITVYNAIFRSIRENLGV